MAEIRRTGIRARDTSPPENPYAPVQRRDALELYITQLAEDGWSQGYCPVCENPGESATPSASFDFASGGWWCFSSDEGHGLSLDAVILHKLDFDREPTGDPATDAAPRPAPPELRPIEDDRPIYDWHDQMMARHPDGPDYLTTKRGLAVATLERFKIGHNGERYTIPVRVDGVWVNVRRYLPGAKQKMLNQPGHGTAALAFTETLASNTLPVLVTEGEWDAVLAWQKGLENGDPLRPRYAVTTGTGGATTVPRDLSKLAEREVFVCYDNDDTGRKGAKKFASAALAAGAVAAHVLDVRKLGVEHFHIGGDLTDAFISGATGSDVLAEMERARAEGAEPEKDDVLRAIEALFNQHADDAPTSLLDKVRSPSDIATLAPARYVIDGWLPVGFFSSVFGAPGAKKTFVLLDMLLHIAAGRDWHGHPVERGAVLLFEGEGLEQLQSRIAAWGRAHEVDVEGLAVGFVDEPVDLTTPEGCARVARTVLQWHAQHGVPVVAVGVDPIVEYMSGEENGEGMELATRGMRALARFLSVALPVGAHTNASGERARGADHLRMRSGAHIRVETLAGDRVGLVQEKQKNGALLALHLTPEAVALPDRDGSLVLRLHRQMGAAEYAVEKASAEKTERTESRRIVLSESKAAARAVVVPALLEAVATEPGIALGRLKSRVTGKGLGSTSVEDLIAELVAAGQIRREIESGGNGTHKHYPGSEADRA